MLDVILLVRFRTLTSPGRWKAQTVLLRVAGSVFLMWLQSRESRRNARLLQHIGCDPWDLGWSRLWTEPCLYICLPVPLRACKHGVVLYVGESVSFQRRFEEHILRLLDPKGQTQQPFYHFVRRGCVSDSQLLAAVSFFMLLPVSAASHDRKNRLEAEVSLTAVLGTLNPPRVYSLAGMTRRRGSAAFGQRIFGASRPLCRIRSRTSSRSSSQIPLRANGHARRDDWKAGLRLTAAALCGHRFSGWQHAAKSAWALSPGAWAFVANRIDRTVEGFRRRRGLNMLRKIAVRRRDLCFPISIVSFSIPWLGSECARQVVLRTLRRLISSWRSKGCWVPVLRHAKCFVTWSSTPKVKDLLSNSRSMNDWLAGKSCPECHCAELRQADPSWPTVVVDGIPHVAASQGTVPWPVSLQHLARWPASFALPPTWDDLASAVREAFRGLRKRCRILQDDPCTDSAIVECTAELWSLFSSGTGGDTPISHADIQAAKTWLRGMFVTVFDHNLSCLAVTCQRLAYEQACKLLDLSGPVSEPNIVWELANTKALQDAIVQMAVVPDLKDEFLMPNNFTKVPKHQWQVGTVAVLPKWKSPGLRWRLIIQKHATPCCLLHSVVSRALDVLLDRFPHHLWSDFMSIQEVVDMVHDFNVQSGQLGYDSGYTVAGDMKDCFRHLPCPDGALMWTALSAWWRDQQVQGVSIPRKSADGKGCLGMCTDPGWIYCSFDSIGAVVRHFSMTNFIHVEGSLGRELQGVPQGDALSSAFLRLWKWYREFVLGHGSSALPNCIAFPETRRRLLHLNATNCLLLDVSYRDDLRMFFAWRSNSPLSCSFLHSWAWQQFDRRFQAGTMRLECTEPELFVGLVCSWRGGQMFVKPAYPDPFAAFCYDRVDSFPLIPWCSWMPPQQKKNAVRGLLCRAFYQSSDRSGRHDAFWDVLTSLVLRAGYPLRFVKQHARHWAVTWVPKNQGRTCINPLILTDIDACFLRLERLCTSLAC